MSPVELDIIESEKWDMKALCNIYGVPSQLLNDADNKTYNNQREGEKALTVRCAIPLLVGIRDNLNRKLHSDWGYRGSDIYVDFDPTVYSELEAEQFQGLASQKRKKLEQTEQATFAGRSGTSQVSLSQKGTAGTF